MTKEIVSEWSSEQWGDLTTMLLYAPYRPEEQTYPCGRREMLVAEVLRDHGLPKTLRVNFWKRFIFSVDDLPDYKPGENWNVPDELLDHPFARAWYCACGKAGADVIRCSHPLLFRPEVKLCKLNNGMLRKSFEAIFKDSPEQLMLPIDIMGIDLPEEFLIAALRARSTKIVTWLFAEHEAVRRMMSLRQLLFYIAANWNDDFAVPVVRFVENCNPGIVADARDSLGRTPLWYTLYRRGFRERVTLTSRFVMKPLAEELIRLGCDPDEENDFGFCYDDFVKTH